MYFTRKTQSSYKITALPFKNWIFGTFIVVFMWFFFGILSGDSTLTCTRSITGQGECVIYSSGGFKKTFPVNELVGAKIDGTKMFSTSIVTKTDTLQLGNMRTSNYSGVAKVVDKINLFVSQQNIHSLKVDNSDLSLLWILIFTMFTGVGIALIVMSRIVILNLDKSKDDLMIRWIGLIPKEQFNCKLSSIKHATYLPADASSKDRASGYIVMLTTTEGEEIPLTDITNGWYKARSMANGINNFIGVKSSE